MKMTDGLFVFSVAGVVIVFIGAYTIDDMHNSPSHQTINNYIEQRKIASIVDSIRESDYRRHIADSIRSIK